MTIEEITKKLKGELKESRFNHSLLVANTARELATMYGADENKAYLAGLVHDCAKGLSHSELLAKIKFYSIELDEPTLSSPQLLHSFVGAYMAKDVYGIDDDEIFDAIYYHTIGKADMPCLTAIIYLADAIEPQRDYPRVDEIRNIAKTSLNRAIYMYAKFSSDFVTKKGDYLHPNTKEVEQYYSQK